MQELEAKRGAARKKAHALLQKLIAVVAELEKLRVKLGLSNSAFNVYLNLRPEDRDAFKSMMTGSSGAASLDDADLLFTGTLLLQRARSTSRRCSPSCAAHHFLLLLVLLLLRASAPKVAY